MVSIILPTYNEKENIVELIEGLYRYIPPPLEVIVVDDDSPDGTWRIAGQIKNPGIKVIRRTDTRGLATAIARGLKEAGGEIVGWMDADMSMPPPVLPEMLSSLEENDIAIGSRYVKGGRDARGFFRVTTSRIINIFAAVLLGGGVKDYDSGFIVMKKKIFEEVEFPSSGYGDYFIELIYKCRKAGFSVREVPYTFREREKGESKTAPSISGFFSLGIGYLRRIICLRFSSQG